MEKKSKRKDFNSCACYSHKFTVLIYSRFKYDPYSPIPVFTVKHSTKILVREWY